MLNMWVSWNDKTFTLQTDTNKQHSKQGFYLTNTIIWETNQSEYIYKTLNDFNYEHKNTIWNLFRIGLRHIT